MPGYLGPGCRIRTRHSHTAPIPIGGTTYANTVDANSNKLTQAQDVSGTASPQYGAAGNTTSDGTNTYSYGVP
jgi:hypothetical protein